MHNFGQKAVFGVDKAREQVANFLNCDTSEIIFTSGATESDNLAIKGIKAKHYPFSIFILLTVFLAIIVGIIFRWGNSCRSNIFSCARPFLNILFSLDSMCL